MPTPPSKTLKVFLCHGKEDKDAVRALYQKLRADGLEPWLDEEDLVPGQDWEPEITWAVETSDVILVCLSRASASKIGFVQKEITLALDVADRQPEGAIFIIPVKLEECGVPDRLRKKHWVNHFEANGYERLRKAFKLRAKQLGIPLAEGSGQSALVDRPPTKSAEPPAVSSTKKRTVPPKADQEAPPPVPQAFIPSDSTKRNPKDGAEMIHIPAGEFLMGNSDNDKMATGGEKPQRRVYLDNYRISKNPMTVAQYRHFCQKTNRHMPPAPSWGWKDDHPIVNVSWDDAQAYCKWAGVVLPTEAQWEKAARGTDGRIYPWGNDWDASKCANSLSSTKPIGSYPLGASPYGCLDMAGNVWEWCADWYDENYYQSAPDRNPTGPDTGVHRVRRGGAWNDFFHTFNFRAARRDRNAPYVRFFFVGFRCVSRQDS